MNVKDYLLKEIKDLSNDENCSTRNLVDSLLVLKFSDGHIHRRLPVSKEILNELLQNVIYEENINSMFSTEIVSKKEVKQEPIVFQNRQAIGDILMMTCAIRDFKAAFPNWPINVSTTAMHIWDNSPYLDRSVNVDNAKVVNIGPSKLTNASNRDDRHFANAFRLSIQEKLNIEFPQGPIKTDIWMTQEEIDAPPLIKPPYWIITAGEKGDWTTKTYPFSRWQKFTKSLPKHTFVQIGVKGGRHKHSVLEGDNIVNFIGKTQGRVDGIRKLFKLFYHAEGSIGMISFQMHLASAFNLPCIVVAGAREPARFTKYPGHQYLATDGCLPCAATNACWSCDIDKSCKQVLVNDEGEKFPCCVDLIEVRDLVRAFEQYYQGKRLVFKKTRTLSLPNVVAPVPFEAHKDINLDAVAGLPEKFGFGAWGGSSITSKDWLFMQMILEQNKVKTVLEFGAGLSSCLLKTLEIDVTTYESEKRWLDTFNKKHPYLNLHYWDGKTETNIDMTKKYDLGFVDGPAGGPNRSVSTRIASQLCKHVIVHDAGREWETKWQQKYLEPTFDHIRNGGHRCKFWSKKKATIKAIKRTNKPLLKLVFNGRGEGGAESSVTWILNKFIAMGWNVQYITPVGACATFNNVGSLKVDVTKDLNAINKPCDILCVYTNDYVWKYIEIAPYFRDLQAKRKVMCVNFRLGHIGKIPWTKEFDDYIFLNSSLKDAFSKRVPNASTHILAPPIDLAPFLENEIPESKKRLELIRHNSQGDTKYPKDFRERLVSVINVFPDILIRLMPAPSFLKPMSNVIQYRRNQPAVPEYLKIGNVFFYMLPEGYHDQGPKVIMEAMASGLPVIADNHSGAKDRVIEGTGFLCDSMNDYIEAMRILSDPEVRFKFGTNARQHAIKTFRAERWIEKIKG